MKSCSPLLLAALLVLAPLSAPAARADMINFGYSWTVQPSSVFASGTGSVTLAANPAGTGQATLNSATTAQIPGANVTTTSSANSPASDSFNTPFNMALQLTDNATQQSGTLTFSGSISGGLTASSSSLNVTFTQPFTQSLTLGQDTWTVSIRPTMLGLPIPGAPAAQISALVSVSNVAETPEPSTLLLGGIACAGLGLFARRRRQQLVRA
jgi:hypothetical protein